MSTPAPAWSALQRERLAALGHAAYVVASAPGTGAVAVAADTRLDPLVLALVRAAGRSPGSPDLAEVLAALPPIDALRRDPAAKRALWPLLRAMRPGRRR